MRRWRRFHGFSSTPAVFAAPRRSDLPNPRPTGLSKGKGFAVARTLFSTQCRRRMGHPQRNRAEEEGLETSGWRIRLTAMRIFGQAPSRVQYSGGTRMSDEAKGPNVDLAHDALQAQRTPLDAIFARTVAVIGATEKPVSVGRTIMCEPARQPVRRDGLPGQPEPAERARGQGVPEAGRRARTDRPGGCRHTSGDGPRGDRRMRHGRGAGAIVISAGFKEVGAAGAHSSGKSSRRRGAGGCG